MSRRARQHPDKRQWFAPVDSVKTGWPPGMLQDDSAEFSKWLASKPDAREHVRDVEEQIEQRRVPNDRQA